MHDARRTGKRVSPLGGWLVWGAKPMDRSWISAAPNHWLAAVPTNIEWTTPATQTTSAPAGRVLTPVRSDGGFFREGYTGYELDDPLTQHVSADRNSTADEADGTWQIYDLQRIRIGALECTVDAPSPTVVTIAYSETTFGDGYPWPVAPLSLGPTCFIQHFIVPAGISRIEPVQTIGGRWVEVRVHGDAKLSHVQFRDRDSLGDPLGSFESSDARLNEIWRVSADTMRAAATDSLVDSSREQAEWVGDTLTVGLENLAIGWGDIRLSRRALVHAAAAADAEGLIAGCGPGERIYLATYAALWMIACVRYSELDGSLELLREMHPAGRRNMAALMGQLEGGTASLPWPFVDWGHVTETDSDLAVLAILLQATKAWCEWQDLLTLDEYQDEALNWQARLLALVRAATESPTTSRGTILASVAGALSPETGAAEAFRHISASFPFNLFGPRLRAPGDESNATATPYFTQFSFPLLFETGRSTEAIDLWRRGWGWMLDAGATTWWEVFDDRWSHSHFWSAAPQWQMTRYLLGLTSGFKDERSVVRLDLRPGDLAWAGGRIPFVWRPPIDVAWRRIDSEIQYQLSSDAPIRLLIEERVVGLPAGESQLILSADGALHASSLLHLIGRH
ncbi:MAG: hypothetical protein JWP75_3073, partial [Frondihabitans sp.]|nr:hypothetical protein [Frondihabitans sp.]